MVVMSHNLKAPEAVFLVRLGTSWEQAGSELVSSKDRALNAFPIYLVPSWERAHSQTD
jgi:hypothetical protein